MKEQVNGTEHSLSILSFSKFHLLQCLSNRIQWYKLTKKKKKKNTLLNRNIKTIRILNGLTCNFTVEQLPPPNLESISAD